MSSIPKRPSSGIAQRNNISSCLTRAHNTSSIVATQATTCHPSPPTAQHIIPPQHVIQHRRARTAQHLIPNRTRNNISSRKLHRNNMSSPAASSTTSHSTASIRPARKQHVIPDPVSTTYHSIGTGMAQHIMPARLAPSTRPTAQHLIQESPGYTATAGLGQADPHPHQPRTSGSSSRQPPSRHHLLHPEPLLHTHPTIQQHPLNLPMKLHHTLRNTLHLPHITPSGHITPHQPPTTQHPRQPPPHLTQLPIKPHQLPQQLPHLRHRHPIHHLPPNPQHPLRPRLPTTRLQPPHQHRHPSTVPSQPPPPHIQRPHNPRRLRQPHQKTNIVHQTPHLPQTPQNRIALTHQIRQISPHILQRTPRVRRPTRLHRNPPTLHIQIKLHRTPPFTPKNHRAALKRSFSATALELPRSRNGAAVAQPHHAPHPNTSGRSTAQPLITTHQPRRASNGAAVAPPTTQ